MRLGIGSFTFPWAVGVPGAAPPKPLSASALLDRASELGVSVVQLCDNLPLQHFSEDELDALSRKATELDLSIELGTRGLQPDRLLGYLDLAKQFRSSLLRVVIDIEGDQPPPRTVVKRLREVVGDFEAANVCLAIENHDRFSAETLASIVQEVSSQAVGICLDTANSLGALEGPLTVAQTLAPYVMSLHAKDCVARRLPHQLGFIIEGRPAGQGQVHFPRVLQAIKHAGRDPNVILELWTPPQSDLAATIALEAKWAEESIGYLSTLIAE